MPVYLKAQEVEIRGTIRDTQGESLPLANLVILPDSVLASTDISGTYAARISAGQKTLRLSYTGYEPIVTSGAVHADTTINFVLTPKVSELKEVVFTSDRVSQGDIVASARAGTTYLTRDEILRMPSPFGEPDVVGAMKLLPGTIRGMEGGSDTFVRGGAADQNLVLLDGAPIYNTGHLLGFLSVFNPDVVENVEMINGGFPAEFGGRLSSVMNITTDSDIPDKTTVSADVGLVSSRMKLTQPIYKDKVAFWVAGRRTYVDQLVRRLTDKDVPYFFEEFNGKLVIHPSRDHQVELSYFGSEDHLDFLRDGAKDGDEMVTRFNSRTSSQTLNWRHVSPGLWSGELSMFRTFFDSRTSNQYKNYSLAGTSEVVDHGAKYKLKRDSIWGDASLGIGAEWTSHDLSPSIINSEGTIADVVKSSETRGDVVNEFAAYIEQEVTLMRGIRLNAGLRGSMAVVRNHRYYFPEPRVSMRFSLGDHGALKASYSRMTQYIHRISNSTVTTPIDVWYPVSEKVRPQKGHQYSLALQQFLPEKKMYFSLEGYYKTMDDLTALEEGANFLFKSDFDSRLIQGQGKAYGMEVLLRKDAGRFTGWIGYSLSWSWRKFDAINDGQWFHARYDRRHNGAIVAQYLLRERWAVSTVWEYISGARFTPVIGQYLAVDPGQSGLDIIPLYAEINSVRLSDTHRLDLGIKLFSKPQHKVQWTLFAGVYNLYNRATPFGIVIKIDEKSNAMEYSQPGLFGLLPFISYGVRF